MSSTLYGIKELVVQFVLRWLFNGPVIQVALLVGCHVRTRETTFGEPPSRDTWEAHLSHTQPYHEGLHQSIVTDTVFWRDGVRAVIHIQSR